MVQPPRTFRPRRMSPPRAAVRRADTDKHRRRAERRRTIFAGRFRTWLSGVDAKRGDVRRAHQAERHPARSAL